jgi:DNA-binding XRE family transcriptional regulator
MIANERQYQVTQNQAKRFELALEELEQNTRPDLHPLLRKAQRESTLSMLETLKAELAEYESLKGGERRQLSLHSLEELPQALIQGRIAAGLKQRELAERLGVKEQQVQHDEQILYASASLERLLRVAKVLDIRFEGQAYFESPRAG